MYRYLTALFILFLINLPAHALKAGEKIPEFSLRDYNGVLHYSGDLCSSKLKEPRVLIIDFFATWCEPCKRSLAVLDKLYSRYEKKGLRVVLISFQEKERAIREFAEENSIRFLVLMDKYGDIAKDFGVYGLPRTFIISGDCTLIKQIIGEKSNLEEILENEVKFILGEKG